MLTTKTGLRTKIKWVLLAGLLACLTPISLTVAGLLTGVYLAATLTGLIGWLKLLNKIVTF